MNRPDGRNARCFMWERLIPELIFMNYNERKQAKRAYAEEHGMKPDDFNPMPEDELKAMSDGYQTAIYTDLNYVNLAPLPSPSKMNYPAEACAKQTKKKAKAMYDDFDEFETPIQTRTDEQKKRDYLASRAQNVLYAQQSKLEKQFHLYADAPSTLKELIERIQAGKFMPLDEKTGKQDSYYFQNHIDWHDPAAPADEAGFKAASVELGKFETQTMDTIKIAEPADGLKALQALEAWTPTGAAN